ncbi:MAG TPA: four-carbon acid sugar kinase family protein [Bacteroidales bacterium]|nr:four-carbon acid sugar kinase family protein [Bacteroidales bacterium]
MSEIKHDTIGRSEKILVVADDLTGAVDTGAQFSRRNLKTIVITGHENLSKSLKDCDVLVVDTESRYDEKEKAYRKAFETGSAARDENIKYLYKKIDSTMRGNPGAEISGLMDSLDISHSFIVPALPLYGRTTINGNVYVKGVLLAETDYASDPKNPVKESYIPVIISAQTDKKTGVISFNDLHEGRQLFITKLHEMMDAGIQIIVIDSEDDEDLDLVASILAGIEGKVMFSGCSGLAEKLAIYIDLDKEKKSSVVIAGSVNKTTVVQVDYASKEPGIKMIDIDPGMILSGQTENEKRRVLDIARDVISTGDDLIIRSISASDTVKRWLAKGNELGMDDFMVSDMIAGFLGEVAAEIIRSNDLKGIVLTGGDTAINTLHSLNVNGIIVRDEILHGIPSGYFNDEKYRDLIVVTKAGGFGEEDALFQILKYLRDV